MISVCMIAKDEEAILEQCLRALSKYKIELVIADTGSKDRTKEIAKKYTDFVYDYEWNDNFADARNFVISKASNDCILVLDCDEIIEKCDLNQLEELCSRHPNKVGRITICNEYERDGSKYCYITELGRVFSRTNFQYEGSIHEQVVSKSGNAYEVYEAPLRVKHYGYDGNLEKRKKKTKRNITMLKKMLETNPEEPYIFYQLGKSYYMQQDYVMAVSYFDQGLCFDVDERLEYVQDMVESYGYALINTKQYEKAMGLIGVYESFYRSSDFIFMIALVLMNNARFEDAVHQFELAASMKNGKVEGVNGYLSYYNMGVIYECLGKVPLAKKYYTYCGNYQPAKERLKGMK